MNKAARVFSFGLLLNSGSVHGSTYHRERPGRLQASVTEGSVVLPPAREQHMPDRKISLKVITSPATGHVMDAPPVLQASAHSIDFTCGHCGTILLHADAYQVHGVLIRCIACGSYNSTDT